MQFTRFKANEVGVHLTTSGRILKCVVSAVKGGQAQGFLTLNQHLSGFGRQPLQKNNVW
jgi:hypothetical protein